MTPETTTPQPFLQPLQATIEDPVRFIHDSKLGVTFGYQIHQGIVIGNIAFTHKATKNTKPDMFSRKKGRSITRERLKCLRDMVDGKGGKYPDKGILIKGREPLNNTLEVRKQIESNICIQLGAIKASYPSYDYRHAGEAQIANDYITNVITGVLNGVARSQSSNTRRQS